MSTNGLGIQLLSGPPIGTFEYYQLPDVVRHGFLRSIAQPAGVWKTFSDRVNSTSENKKRQFGHAA